VTLALPQDVQAEAWDWDDDLFARRVWHVSRQAVAEDALARATCTSCGVPATARATTWSTASPAWATRSPVGSA
jgi:hypothetical protein